MNITAQLAWIDLEMTGLNPNKDRILEIAAIITDWHFNEIATFESGVGQPTDEIIRLLDKNPFYAEFPETKQQLLALNAKSPSETKIEQQLIAFLDKYFSSSEPIVLAGNSIHQDRRFIRQWWPLLEQRLHYRMLDVSAWKIVMEGKFNTEFSKTKQHRALQDIRESIAELTFYLRWFGNPDN